LEGTPLLVLCIFAILTQFVLLELFGLGLNIGMVVSKVDTLKPTELSYTT